MKRIQLQIQALSPLAIARQKPGGSVSEVEDYIPGTVIRGAVAAQILQQSGHRSTNLAENGGDFQALFLGDEPAIFQNAYPAVLIVKQITHAIALTLVKDHNDPPITWDDYLASLCAPYVPQETNRTPSTINRILACQAHMPYSQFTTIAKVKEAFGIKTVEGERFFPDVEPVTPSNTLLDYLSESVPLAVAASTEKFRSEAIVAPILIELRRILKRRISLFSGEEFNVDESVGLNGVCDFIISGSAEQMAVEAPVIVLLEAKKGDLRLGVGQCVAEMIAAQRFNHASLKVVNPIYGCITTGTAWRFMRLIEQTVEIDLTDYQLTPVSQILGFFLWMIKDAFELE